MLADPFARFRKGNVVLFAIGVMGVPQDEFGTHAGTLKVGEAQRVEEPRRHSSLGSSTQHGTLLCRCDIVPAIVARRVLPDVASCTAGPRHPPADRRRTLAVVDAPDQEMAGSLPCAFEANHNRLKRDLEPSASHRGILTADPNYARPRSPEKLLPCAPGQFGRGLVQDRWRQVRYLPRHGHGAMPRGAGIRRPDHEARLRRRTP